jgi:hypothetical protein
MPSIVVRFPDGSKEFRFPERMLEEDDLIWHAGERFRVISIITDGDEQAVVTVEPSGGIGDALRSEEGAIRLTPLDENSV